jgi:hypothetical protein
MSAAILLPVIGILCVAIYFMDIRVKREHLQLDEAHFQAQQERKDKQYLLNRFQALGLLPSAVPAATHVSSGSEAVAAPART